VQDRLEAIGYHGGLFEKYWDDDYVLVTHEGWRIVQPVQTGHTVIKSGVPDQSEMDSSSVKGPVNSSVVPSVQIQGSKFGARNDDIQAENKDIPPLRNGRSSPTKMPNDAYSAPSSSRGNESPTKSFGGSASGYESPTKSIGPHIEYCSNSDISSQRY